MCKNPSSCEEGFRSLNNVSSNKIDLINKNAKNNIPFSGDTYRAIFFLEKITHIKSNVAWGDVSTYDNYEDFKEDRRKWENWLKKNRCTFSDDDVKEIEDKVISETSWID